LVKPPSLPSSWQQDRQLDAAGHVHAQVAVHREDRILRLQRARHADRDGFLADPREPLRELALPQQAQHLLFDQARAQQRTVERAQFLIGKSVGHGLRRRRFLRRLRVRGPSSATGTCLDRVSHGAD
jgi:hypothetical protein